MAMESCRGACLRIFLTFAELLTPDICALTLLVAARPQDLAG